MTDKQEKILNAALELFAIHGYNAVSTSKIAKEANVSEGLIFRHFGNKKGLLDAILNQAYERATLLYSHIVSEEDPKKTIRETITLPFRLKESEYHFWKLQFKLKWELEISGADKVRPLLEKMAWAFEELNYKEPCKEAQTLHHIGESILGGILRDGIETQIPLKDFLLKKYDV
ncbi:TetR/AcrR family transcriptional regulator [Flagellimonas meridianipacifica]|uniref:Regulatory TetR family protein n=1 Tax=Flagellimonas meridianipacifica TaxID=1080225 RepID=A0A2T0MHZ8_9FLAO|nr:TetR/AcrR family transcriptional regulator [Allomuricauda pacifica]PRX57175.1 regulatory TetR family protein [Allomuricauda pacifica]